MAAMGSKIEAKQRVRAFDVPTVPGYDGDDQSPARLRNEAERDRLSAARSRPAPAAAAAACASSSRSTPSTRRSQRQSAKRWRRSATMRCCSNAICAIRATSNFKCSPTRTATTIHLGERECSIQRRHQKIVEEAPSVALSPELRAEMGAAAVRAAASVGYVNAGTCEFMLDSDGTYYFLEMNTRLQVEHPVTELVYGIDLVQWQLAHRKRRSALRSRKQDVRPRGWAIEARIYAEDPANHMLPSTGTHHALVAAGRARRSRRRRRHDRQRGERLLRSDAREADRLRQRSRTRDRALERALDDFSYRRRAREPSAAAMDRARRGVSRRARRRRASWRNASTNRSLPRAPFPREAAMLRDRTAFASTATRHGASAASACRSGSRRAANAFRIWASAAGDGTLACLQAISRANCARIARGERIDATFGGAAIAGIRASPFEPIAPPSAQSSGLPRPPAWATAA